EVTRGWPLLVARELHLRPGGGALVARRSQAVRLRGRTIVRVEGGHQRAERVAQLIAGHDGVDEPAFEVALGAMSRVRQLGAGLTFQVTQGCVPNHGPRLADDDV